MKKVIQIISILAILGFVFSACTTDVLQMGPNGDARLRYLEIKGVDLVPDFSPTVQNYTALVTDPANAKIKVAPFLYFTRFSVNGETVIMKTNVYGLPDYTPYSMEGISNITVVTKAEDGLSRTYKVTLLEKEKVDAALTSIGCSTGILTPTFKEGRAPKYISYSAITVTNIYALSVTNTSYSLALSKSASNASLTVNGAAVGTGQYSGSLGLTHPGSGTQSLMVTNISPNGAFTNVKKINVTYVDPTTDARAQDVKFYNASSGAEITYIKSFNPSRTGYSIVLDNVDTVKIDVTTVQSGATVTVFRDTIDTDGNYTIQNTYTGTQLNSITCEMGDKITVRVSHGGSQTDYVWLVTMYTSSQGYGFDGNIGNFLRFIHQVKEWGSTSEPWTVSGIVTMDVSSDDGFFIEDSQYGLYVWAGWYNKTGLNLRVGQKVSITFKYAKLWMGLAEIAYASAYNDGSIVVTTIVDKKPRPIFYQTTKQWYSVADATLNIYNHAARMVRYEATDPIASTFNSSDIGEFTQGYSFKLATDYGNEDYTRTYADAVRYMKEDDTGTFFGPLLYDGTMYLFTAHSNSMIIPWDVRAPE